MKRMKKLTSLILTLAFAYTAMFSFSTVAKAAYTYRVNIILGGTGEEGSAFLPGFGDKLSADGKTLTFENLEYGDQFIFNPKDAVAITPQEKTNEDGTKVTYSKYYVKGFRKSGDNNLSKSAFKITGDETFVIAYGVGEVVPYTVNFVDKAGNKLLESATYYGAAGEEVYVPYRYVDGYQLDASCKENGHIKALKANQVVNFVYVKSSDVNSRTVYNTTENTTYSTVTGLPEYVYQVVPTQGVVDDAGIANNRNQNAGQAAGGAGNANGNPDGADAGEDSQATETTEISEPEVPEGAEDVFEIEDEEVAKNVDQSAIMQRYIRYLIIIAVIGVMVVLTGIIGTYKIERDKRKKN